MERGAEKRSNDVGGTPSLFFDYDWLAHQSSTARTSSTQVAIFGRFTFHVF